MDKYTDDQIKKALERMSEEDPEGFSSDVLDLTNRYEAEIERLQGVIATITKDRDIEHKCHLRLLNEIKTAKSEAIKEFAEELKIHLYYPYEESIDEEIINSLVKEMVGEGE